MLRKLIDQEDYTNQDQTERRAEVGVNRPYPQRRKLNKM